MMTGNRLLALCTAFWLVGLTAACDRGEDGRAPSPAEEQAAESTDPAFEVTVDTQVVRLPDPPVEQP